MVGHDFELELRPDGNGRLIVDLAGDINATAGVKLESVQAQLEGADVKTIVLDFEDVDYINSTGIALIVGLLARARAANLGVVAYGLSDHYQEIFQITRLADFMGIFPDREAALRAAPA